MRQSLEIKVSQEDSVSKVILMGAIDTVSVEQLKSEVLPLCEKPEPRIIMDCTRLSYVNSMCMGQFSFFAQRAEASGGKLVLFGLDASILEVMRLIHLHEVLPICETRDEALKRVGAV